MIKSLRAKFTLYPILLGFYPVLALIAHNAAEMELLDGGRALVSAFLFTLLLFAIVLLIIKNPTKSALLTSLLLFLFFSYGQLNILARNWTVLNLTLGRHRVLIPIYLFILIIFSWLILKTKRDLSGIAPFLNALAILLMIFPLYQIAAYQLEDYIAQQNQRKIFTQSEQVSLTEVLPPPDVYYIVLDGYPRGDFIEQYLGSSNFEFLKNLENRGLYVAHCSQSNYSDTRFSLASTLNMNYLDDGGDIPEVIYPGSKLDNMIRNGKVQKNFSDLGYTIITFESGYKWLGWESSDLHLSPAKERLFSVTIFGINDFEKLLLDTTAVKLLFDLPFLFNPNQMNRWLEIVNNPRDSHRERVLYALEKLPVIPEEVAGPKFVYAHIIFPHPPFVFDSEGRQVLNSPSDEITAYADQITYLDKRLLEIIDSLLEKSDPEPIIILQGDHGATIEYKELGIDPAYRLGIFNAYYLPSSDNEFDNLASTPNESMYPSISPVNTFRLIFDQYFNGDYDLLDDRSIVGRQSPYIKLDCSLPD